MGLFTACCWTLMKARANPQPDCIGSMRKIVEGDSNWDIYITREGYCRAVPKPGTGCDETVYGNMRYVQRMFREGYIKPSQLTRLGRHLLGI